MKIKIIETEIIDNKIKDENNVFCPSGVSVIVRVELENKTYGLDFQTTNTADYGAISTSLAAYTDSEYDRLKSDIDDDEKLQELMCEIKKKSNVQGIWQKYIDENYIMNDDHFGGMDANSQRDEMTRKDG